MRFPRLVRDLSGKLGKQVDLVLRGQGHRARPHRRRRARRPARPPHPQLARPRPRGARGARCGRQAARPARSRSRARPTGGGIVITVARRRPRRRSPRAWPPSAVERGLITADEAATRSTCRAPSSCSSAPGFSTAEQATRRLRPRRRHGRGPHRIRELGGDVHHGVRHRPGHDDRDPPAAVAGDHVGAARRGRRQHRSRSPIDRIERTVRVDDWTVRGVAGRPMLVMGDEVCPLIDASARSPGVTTMPRTSRTPCSCARRPAGRSRSRSTGCSGSASWSAGACPPEVGDGRSGRRGAPCCRSGEIALIVDVDGLTREHDRAVRDDAAAVKEENHGLHRTAARRAAASWPTSARARPAPRWRRCSAARSTSRSRRVVALPLGRGRSSAVGDPELPAHRRSKLDIFGDLDGTVLLVFALEDAAMLCGLLGVEPDSEVGRVRPRRDRQHPRHVVRQRARPDDRHGGRAVPARRPPPTCSARSSRRCCSSATSAGDTALLLDSAMFVEGEQCELSFLLVPSADGVADLLEPHRDVGSSCPRPLSVSASSSPPRIPRTCSCPSAWGRASAWR